MSSAYVKYPKSESYVLSLNVSTDRSTDEFSGMLVVLLETGLSFIHPTKCSLYTEIYRYVYILYIYESISKSSLCAENTI